MKLEKSRLILIVGVILAATLILSACAPKAPAPEVEPIHVGMPISLTGPGASDHEEGRRGIVLAYEDINAEGGLLGREIVWHIEDTGNGSMQEEINARDRLLQHDPVWIWGTWHPDQSMAAIYGEIDPIFAACTFSQKNIDIYLEDPDKHYNIFNIGGNELPYPANTFRAATQLLPENEGVEYRNNKYAIQVWDESTTHQIAMYFNQLMQGAGWENVYEELNPAGQLEWGVQLTKMKAADPSIIYFADWLAPDAASFIDQFLRDPWDAWIFIVYAGAQPEFLDLLGTKGDGCFWDTSGQLIPGEKQEAWLAHYIDRWGEPPAGSNAVWAYDMVIFWANCVEKVGDPKAYREIADCFCSEVQPNMLTGDWVFDPETHASQQDEVGNTLRPFHTYQVQNGENVEIFIGADQYAPIITPPWFGQ